MTGPKNLPGHPDHAAPATGPLSSLPFRTFIQGVGFDLVLALCLVVYDATSGAGHGIAWGLLGLTLIKTGLMTAASSVMRRLRPPAA